MTWLKTTFSKWSVAFKDDAAKLTCCDLAGHEVLQLRASESDLAWDTHKRIARGLAGKPSKSLFGLA